MFIFKSKIYIVLQHDILHQRFDINEGSVECR